MTSNATMTPIVIVTCPRSHDHACRALEAAIPAHGFGLLGVHDLAETLRSKGFTFAEECRIFELCQPQQAMRVLSADMALNMALPCRISVYTEGGQTKIGMVSPVAMLAGLSTDAELQSVAAEVEVTTRAMIEAVAAGST